MKHKYFKHNIGGNLGTYNVMHIIRNILFLKYLEHITSSEYWNTILRPRRFKTQCLKQLRTFPKKTQC